MSSLKVVMQGKDITRINQVRDFASHDLLTPKNMTVGMQEADAVTLAQYTATQVTVWQSAGPVPLAYGQAPAGNLPAPLRIWTLPDSLVNLGVPQRAVVPRMALKVGSYDQATGQMVRQPVGYYSWAMQVGLQIKRIPPVAGSPASQWTYELTGASEYNMVLLERLLGSIAATNYGIVGDLTLLYHPSPTGDAREGLQSDGNKNVAFFLTQVNLSTDTHPAMLGRSLAAASTEQQPTGCYNTPYDFLRMLWEGSITRSGGYFLYYYNLQSQQGLPDRIFNDRGQAELELLITFRPQSDADRNRVQPFMNCVVTGDISVTPRGDADQSAGQTDPAASFSVYAETDPEQLTVPLQGRSLADLAAAFYTDPILIGEQNATLPLVPGKSLTVASGVYQVGPGAPGGDLDAIAQAFRTTADALKAANPRITNWENLPLYRAIRLPVLQVMTQPGDQLLTLAAKYGERLSALIAENQRVAGLFPDNPPLQVTTGPSLRSPLVPPGVAEVQAQRDQPPPVPQDPNDKEFASDYLQSMFHMLGYKVWANQDFTESNSGLPVGPADPVGEDGLGDKARLPEADPTQPWSYSRAVPFYKFAQPGGATQAGGALGDLPPATDSPYQGIGDLLQLDLAWQDIFGNQILTPLNVPTPGSPLNRPPMLLGYTDTLLGPGQWPSVACTYQVLPASNNNATLQINFNFNTAPYEGAETEDPPAWQQAAQGDLLTYRKVYYQLNQVLGNQDAVAYSWESSLLPDGPRPLDDGNVSQLKSWVDQIYAYLALRAQKQPAVVAAKLTLTQRIPLDELNAAQVFELAAALLLERPALYADADFRTSPPVWQSVTALPALRDADQQSDGLSLKTFATGLESALQVPGKFQLKVATGPNRTRLAQTGTDSPVWVVRLGLEPGQAITYSVLNPGEPMIYAPTPLANTLQSRGDVPIWDYKPESGQPINFDDPPDRTLTFGGIDLDVWGQQFLAAVDQVLSPEYTSAAGILSKQTGRDYIRNLLDQKEQLAGAVGNLVMHVFAADHPPDPQTQAAREAFRQQLLVQLSNAYTTDAVIQFQAGVNADVDTGPGQTPGQLYGPLVAPSGTQLPDTVGLTAPKIPLAPADATNPALLNVLLTSRSNKQDPASTAVQPYVTLNAAYQPTYIEHQIGKLPGIQNYQASSWLSFVIQPDPAKPATWPLYGSLGTFLVPLVLRAYPTPPSMVAQAQEEPQTGQCQATGPLARALLWDFAFTYGEFYHYPQDRTYFTVQFNIRPLMRAQAALMRDLFADLAEYVTVFPAVRSDLDQYLRPIDNSHADATAFQRADVALRSFTEMVQRVSQSWQGWHSDRNLRGRFEVGAQAQYDFYISEQAGDDGNLVVTLVETGARPAGVGAPVVQIDGYQTTATAKPGQFQYTFTDSKGEPLTAERGLAIAPRKVVLPCLNVVVFQDAWASGRITRNEELVPGRRSADPFIYQTTEVRFTSPLMPRVDKTDPIDIAAVGGTTPVVRTLADQLSHLFTTLFSGEVPEQQQIQLECRYAYPLPNNLQLIALPVLMVPATPVDITKAFVVPPNWTPGAYDPAASFVCNLTSAIWQWFGETLPKGGGQLQVDLTVMSSLTPKLVPLVRLEGLYLGLESLNPKPPVMAG